MCNVAGQDFVPGPSGKSGPVPVHQLDGESSRAHRWCYAFVRVVHNIADSEDSRLTGLAEQRPPVRVPATGGHCVVPGQVITLGVGGHASAEPFGARLPSDHHEEAVSRERTGLTAAPISYGDVLQPILTGAADHVALGPDDDVAAGLDLADQIARHSLGQPGAADDDTHSPGNSSRLDGRSTITTSAGLWIIDQSRLRVTAPTVRLPRRATT